MSIFIKPAHMPYKSCEDCLEQLNDIEPIDYFFAQHIVSTASADVLASIEESNEQVNSALIFHILLGLSSFQRKGSACITLEQLANKCMFSNKDADEQNILENNNEEIKKGYMFPELTLLQSTVNNWLALLHKNTEQAYFVVYENGYLYSKRYFYYEQFLCQFVQSKILQQQEIEHIQAVNEAIRLFTKQQQKELPELLALLFDDALISDSTLNYQQLAVINALYNTFSIITGGAGTGKTYTVARLVLLLCSIFNIPHEQIELVAPTGKAANRLVESLQQELLSLSLKTEFASLSEALGAIQSKTLHRLLKIDSSTGIAGVNEHNQLSAKLVIVDEASMIDISLMHKLISSLRSDARLVLVGDANQLPSVESGSLLADLASHTLGAMSLARWQMLCELLPAINQLNTFEHTQNGGSFVTRLKDSKRSTQGIFQFSQSILETDIEQAKNADNFADVTLNFGNVFANMASITQFLKQKVLPHYVSIIQAKSLADAFDSLKAYALLSPFKTGLAGVDNLNLMIESLLRQVTHSQISNQFYKGRPLMVLQNDYQLGLFNGDTGICWPNEQGKLVVYFESVNKQYKAIPIYNLPAVQSTYAMTIHKTQGSEYVNVDLLLPPQRLEFITKQLFYTGVTRAKEHVSVYTNVEVFEAAITQSVERISGIDKALK